MLQIGAQRRTLTRQKRRPRVSGDQERAIVRNFPRYRENDFARFVTLRLERAQQTPDTVTWHLDDPRRGVAVAVAGAAF